MAILKITYKSALCHTILPAILKQR